MQAHSKIAVAGATGRVGRHLVDVLEARGHEVVPIARSRGVDVITGDGLAGALSGVTCVIDAATGPSSEQEPATAFFTTAARNLQEAGQRAGVERIVVVSIIGCDRFAGGYNAAKVAHEQALQAGPIPVDVLRAAQFHEFVELLVQWGTRDGVSHVPGIPTQPVAARTVAEALADMATAAEPRPAGAPIAEIAGPREERMDKLAELYVARRGLPLRIEGASDPSDPDTPLFEQGGLLPSPHAALAGPTFEAWLESQDG